MHQDRYSENAPGHLVETELGGETVSAFLPNGLPPIDIAGREIIEPVGDASYELGQLDSQFMTLPDSFGQHLRYIEAATSTQLEGIPASVEDMYAADLGVDAHVEHETAAAYGLGYVDALHYGYRHLADGGEFTREFIKDLHERIMQSEDTEVGEFRSIQNFIGTGRTVSSAVYIPPPPSHVPSLVRDLCHFLNTEKRTYPPVVRAALAHYQFETIHPFVDGNGRVGRVLAVLQLVDELDLTQPYLLLSPGLKRNRRAYFEGLRGVSSQNEWASWITFFTTNLTAQIASVSEYLSSVQTVVDDYMTTYADANTSKLDALFMVLAKRPYVTAAAVAEETDMTYKTANEWLNRLEADDALTEITGKQRNRIFRADGVLRAANTLQHTVGAQRY